MLLDRLVCPFDKNTLKSLMIVYSCPGGYLGYDFPNNIVLEIDTVLNYEFYDSTSNPVSIHYGGSRTAPNSPYEDVHSIGYGSPIGFSLGAADTEITIQLHYDHDFGLFEVYYIQNGQPNFILRTRRDYFIDSMLDLDQGKAWIGIIGAGGAYGMDVNIGHFEFTTDIPQTGGGVVVICPSDLVVTASTKTCTFRGSTGTPQVIAPSGSGTYSKSPRPPYPIGTNWVKYLGIDNRNLALSGECTQRVQVNAPAGGSCPS